jgi:hypothetical protein
VVELILVGFSKAIRYSITITTIIDSVEEVDSLLEDNSAFDYSIGRELAYTAIANKVEGSINKIFVVKGT